jgi:hypothetical protein
MCQGVCTSANCGPACVGSVASLFTSTLTSARTVPGFLLMTCRARCHLGWEGTDGAAGLAPPAPQPLGRPKLVGHGAGRDPGVQRPAPSPQTQRAYQGAPSRPLVHLVSYRLGTSGGGRGKPLACLRRAP